MFNGRRSYGTFAVHTGVNLAIEKARSQGIGAVGITNCNHAGAMFGWVKMIVDGGMIGLVICSAGPRGGSMVPFGGIGKALAGNPIGFGVPGGATGPMIADFSTARAAGGKVLMALQSGEPIPEDWVFDAEGKPTTDPAAFMTPDLEITGMMRPFGGHKGYAIATFAEVLGAILTGYGPAYKDDYIEGNGTFIIAIDVPPFIDLDVFRQEVDGLFSKVKSVPTEDGVDEVLIPGEMEARTRAQREADSIPFPDGTWQTIADTANELGVEIPTKKEIEAANNALDHYNDLIKPGQRRHDNPALRGTGRLGLRGTNVLQFEHHPYCEPFRKMLAHPQVVSRLNVMCGNGFRLDHGPQFIGAVNGTQGGTQHGSGHPHKPGVGYHHQNGEFHVGGVTVT